MQTYTLDDFLTKYIEDYMFGDIKSVKDEISEDTHPGNAAYLMTSALCSGIEFLGTLLQEWPEAQKCEACKMVRTPGFSPFMHFCDNYLAQVDERYKAFGIIGRELIRNGLMHSFATKGKVAITRQGARDSTHLVRYTEAGLIAVNPNFLYEDFKKSYYDYVRPELSKGKLRERAVHNYETLRNRYGSEIERTLQEANKKLNSWPWLQKDIPFDPRMSEIIEENGDLILVS